MNSQAPQPAQKQEAGTRRPRVLVADDDFRIVEMLQFALSGNGFEVLTASDGEEARQAALKGRPDLAILDLRMPRRSGVEVTEELRADPSLAHMPVVILSGNGDTEVRLDALMRGADDFLVKPFSPRELMLKCRRLLERTEACRTLEREQRQLVGQLAEERRAREDLRLRAGRESSAREIALGLHRELAAGASLDTLCHDFLVRLMGGLGCGSAAVLLHQPAAPQHFTARQTMGFPSERTLGLRLRTTDGLATLLGHRRRWVRLREAEQSGDLKRECAVLQALGVTVVAPVASGASLIGLLLLGERRDGRDHDRADLDLAQLMGEALATAAETHERLRLHQEATLRCLASVVDIYEARSILSRGHTARVAEYSVQLACALELPSAEVEAIRQGALLHDLGKTGISDSVLDKPGRLDEEEMNCVKEHSRLGADILGPLHFLDPVHDIVRHHHERPDGRGYPDGLHGAHLSLAARIVAVADSFDAMTIDRPYRAALSAEQTVKILREGSGTQYDTAVVEALVSELRAGRMRVLWAREKEAA